MCERLKIYKDLPQRNLFGAGTVYFFVLPLFFTVFDFAFNVLPFAEDFFFTVTVFFCGRYFKAEWAAARRAMGTRNGEQET